MANEEFFYEKLMKEVNKIVSPQETCLPTVHMKTNAMARINEKLRDMLNMTRNGNHSLILYRYMPISFNAISGIMNDDVYMVPASKMNDAFEGAAFGTMSSEEDNLSEIDRIQNDVYLKSFSCIPNNILMWSHYGDYNRGICIGYDFIKEYQIRVNQIGNSQNVIDHLYPVQYSDARFSNTYVDRIDSHPFLYLRKSKCWEYEKEFRLIYEASELEHGNSIKMNCISEVQFGLRTDPQQIEIIKSLIRGRNIRLYKTKQEENSFKLTREEI